MALGRQRRYSRTICDSLFCTVAVATPLVLSLAYYRNDLRTLLRLVFLGLVLFGALLTVRHSLRRALRRLTDWLASGKKEEEGEDDHRPDLDQARDEALARAQRKHDEKAHDFERRVAGPRRERKLGEAERKMRHIRGFGDDGEVLGGQISPGGPDRGASRLLQSRGDQSQSVAGSRDSRVTGSDQSRVRSESRDSHMTDDDDVGEGDQSGNPIWILVRLPDRTLRKQFYTSQTVKVLNNWLTAEGYPTQQYVACTLHPRRLLDERGQSFEECGITMDTRLVLEERED